MTKLDLTKHSDKEIVKAIFQLPAGKFIQVINAISAISVKAEKRGQFIAEDQGDEIVNDMIKQLFEGDEE